MSATEKLSTPVEIDTAIADTLTQLHVAERRAASYRSQVERYGYVLLADDEERRTGRRASYNRDPREIIAEARTKGLL